MFPEPHMIGQESQMNFQTLIKAVKNDDVALVSCKDAKGRQFDVLAIVSLNGANLDEYIYIPFAVMATPSLYPLFNKIKPPETLQGEWFWYDDDDLST